MNNLIIWAHQATVDYNYPVRGILSDISNKIIEKNWLSQPSEDKDIKEVIRVLQQARGQGLEGDKKTFVPDQDIALHDLNEIRRMLMNEYKITPDVQIGGDPAIAAIRGHMLRLPDSTNLPLVRYAGLFPKSVENALNKNLVNDSQEILENVFRIPLRYSVEGEPCSVGLESDMAKLILIYGPSRSIVDISSNGNFNDFLKKIGNEVMTAGKKGLIVLAVNAARPKMVGVPSKEVFNELADIVNGVGHLEMLNYDKQEVSELVYLMRLLKDVKETSFGDRVRTFVATRDFGNLKEEENMQFAGQVFTLLKHADIVSANDSEIHALHTAFKEKKYRDIPLAYKLRELPFKAIKLCHSSDGVIMDLGCRPEHIITSSRFRENPAGFLEEVLRLSADGATYAMDATAGLGRLANEAMIRIYSQNVRDETRQYERFRYTFLNITEPMPAGMISIASARVVRTLGAIVGLGAIFDGLLLSFLMRD